MRVLAALSGGVDSAVAAARAVEAGHEVTAVHMALSSAATQSRCGSRGCCTLEDASDAARASAKLGIPFYVWDLAGDFEHTVMADFISEYEAGRTPNPCIRCNEFVKFQELLQRARALGFDAVCTGHYAQVKWEQNLPQLHRAADLLKDQSYVLAVMGKAALREVIFPLGDVKSKAEVRQEAQARGLTVSQKPDSYDICFIPDGDTAGFLQRKLGRHPGNIISSEGEVLGQHEGYFAYTVGQRKGLNLGRPAADGKPRYVLETRPETNEVVVGPAQLLQVTKIKASNPVWLVDENDPIFSDGGAPVSVQVRAHGKAVPCVAKTSGTDVEIEITGCEHGTVRGMRAIAAGQTLVLYRGTQVLGQATISAAAR